MSRHSHKLTLFGPPDEATQASSVETFGLSRFPMPDRPARRRALAIGAFRYRFGCVSGRGTVGRVTPVAVTSR